MDSITLLSFVLLIIVFLGIVSHIIVGKQRKLRYMLEDRRKWREALRKIAEDLGLASYTKTLKLLTRLKLRINAYGNDWTNTSYISDVHIWQLINDIENNEMTDVHFEIKKKQLVEYISALLKYDREETKKEVKGSIYYSISLIVELLMLLYSGFIILISNHGSTNFDSSQFVLIIILFAFVIFGTNIWINCEGKIICKKVLYSKLLMKIMKKTYIKIRACYVVAFLGRIILLIFVIPFIFMVFSCDVANKVNDNSIWIIVIMYSLIIFVQFIPEKVEINNKCHYISVINSIKSKYDFCIDNNKVELMKLDKLDCEYIELKIKQQKELANKINKLIRIEKLPDDKVGFEFAKKLFIEQENFRTTKVLGDFIILYLVKILSAFKQFITFILGFLSSYFVKYIESFNVKNLWLVFIIIVLLCFCSALEETEKNKLEQLSVRILRDMSYEQYKMLLEYEMP